MDFVYGILLQGWYLDSNWSKFKIKKKKKTLSIPPFPSVCTYLLFKKKKKKVSHSQFATSANKNGNSGCFHSENTPVSQPLCFMSDCSNLNCMSLGQGMAFLFFFYKAKYPVTVLQNNK